MRKGRFADRPFVNPLAHPLPKDNADMPEAIAVVAPLQPVSRRFSESGLSNGYSRRWDKSHRWVRRLLHPTVTETYMCILESGRRRICVRHLAALRGVSVRTVRYHLGAMERARVLRVVRTRIGPRKNAPNIFILLDIDGTPLGSAYPATDCREKPDRKIKPTTPPPARRRHQNHFPQMHKLYNQNGLLMAQLRGVRALLRSQRPAPRRPDACVGMWRPERPDGYYSGLPAEEGTC